MKEWYRRTQGESASNRPESARLSAGMIWACFLARASLTDIASEPTAAPCSANACVRHTCPSSHH